MVHAIADGLLVSEVVATSLAWRYSDKHKVPMVPKPSKQADGKGTKVEPAKEKPQEI